MLDLQKDIEALETKYSAQPSLAKSETDRELDKLKKELQSNFVVFPNWLPQHISLSNACVPGLDIENVPAFPYDLQELCRRYGEVKVPVRVLFGESDAILDPAVHGESMGEALSNFQLTLWQ